MASKILQNPDIAAYERIRSYVIGQMSKSGGSSMRLASYRELAKQFDVTPPTVLKALKGLISEGFLTVKPGVGTFTNPARQSGEKGVRLIGCFSGDGRNILMEREYWQVLPAFMDAILKNSGCYKIQHGFLGSAGLSPEEISRMGLDGIIWFCPDLHLAPSLQEIKRRCRVPVMSVMRRCPGVSSFYFDNEPDNFQIASKMLGEGRRKILLMLPAWEDPGAVRGVERAFAAHGASFDHNWIVRDSDTERAIFRRTLTALQPEGIIFNSNISSYWPMLKGSPEIEERCRLCTGVYPLHDDMEYVGWMLVPNLLKEAALAASNFSGQFADLDSAEAIDRHFTTNIVFERKCV